MSREKQIEEMADDIDEAIDNNMTWHDIDGITNIDTDGMANELIKKGYVMQSEREWLRRPRVYGVGFIYVCSCCEESGAILNNYCPNCGAKMKGGAEK